MAMLMIKSQPLLILVSKELRRGLKDGGERAAALSSSSSNWKTTKPELRKTSARKRRSKRAA
jgi:hypothetical protein